MVTGSVPTRWESRVRAGAYAFAFAAGTWVLITPPRTIEGTIGVLSTVAWGVLLLPASVVMVFAWRGKWRPEYALLPLLVAGVTVYAVAVWASVWETITRGPQACTISALALALLARFMQLRKLRRRKAVVPGEGGVWDKNG